MLRGALLVSLIGLAACARLGIPGPALPGSGNRGMAELVENRVWIDESPDAPRGSLRAFLSDGTLVMTSCAETYRLAPWRWVENGTLVWEEDGRVLRAGDFHHADEHSEHGEITTTEGAEVLIVGAVEDYLPSA